MSEETTEATGTGAKRCGMLAQGQPGLDISAAARDAGTVRLCGAAPRGERQHPCRQLAMPNGRCWLHGGRSTGPRTPEGLSRARRATWRHGERSAEALAERRAWSKYLRALAAELAAVERGGPVEAELVARVDDAARVLLVLVAGADPSG